ncbi:DNA pilot protein [Tortoise microvirus 36]|nr:DNA pilot protein [Tortoise microvirus 36]
MSGWSALGYGLGALVNLYGINQNREQQGLANSIAQQQYAQSMEFSKAQFKQQKSDVAWQQNFALDEQAYQRALTQTQFERQDTAIQRSVADATAAGFSPLAVVGSPSQSTVSSPSMSAPSATSSAPIPALPHLMANPMDYSSFAQLAASAASTYAKEQEISIQKESLLDSKQKWRAELDVKLEMQTKELTAASERLISTLSSQESIASSSQETQRDIASADVSQRQAQLAETIRNNNNLITETANNRVATNNRAVREMLSQAGFWNQRPCTPQEYAVAMPQYIRAREAFYQRMISSGVLVKTSESTGSQHSESLGLKGADKSSGGFNIAGSRGEYYATSKDALGIYQEEEKRFNLRYALPILLEGSGYGH